ncbi:MAG: hypothetical protein Q8N08_08000 [Methanobacteriaceae archaeon]|nr:hypothetical protein [Methanobacteriaceae archaeon]
MSAVKPGLADANLQTGSTVNKTLSMKKLLKLKDNYQELMDGKIVPLGVNSTIIMHPLNNSLETIFIGDPECPNTTADVFIINRTVLCNYHVADILATIISSEKPYLISNSSTVCCPHCNLSGDIQHPHSESVSLKPG